jgi:hypothetical protein
MAGERIRPSAAGEEVAVCAMKVGSGEGERRFDILPKKTLSFDPLVHSAST